MALVRESVYAALFARLSAVPGLKTKSRRLLPPGDVPAINQPALFLAQTGQRFEYAEGRTVFCILGAAVYVYARDPAGKNPGAIINPIMDGIQAALAPDNAMVNACTLGGIVHWCRMGDVETDEGTMGEQAILRIPIEMKAPG